MAIYKLGDIAKIKRGSSPRPITTWLSDTGLPWAKISDINNNAIYGTRQFVKEGWKSSGLIGEQYDLFITNSATPGIPFIQRANKSIAYHDGFLKIIVDDNVVMKKYLFYKLILDRPKLIKMGNGAVFVNLSSQILKDWCVDIPNIHDQQKIIDIIEQNENLFLKFNNCIRIDCVNNTKQDMKSLIDIIEPIEKSIELVKGSLHTLKEHVLLKCKLNYDVTKHKYNFTKGGSPLQEGKTPFLNVSAANGKINRFVLNEPNIFYGDITLSLDGNIGLVNNYLEGFNGYLYKVSHPVLKPFEIYFSLQHRHNQNIMKINTTGTTIKHSPNSKKEIVHIDFTDKDFLENAFNVELSLKSYLIKLKAIKSDLIKLLIV